MPVELPNRFDRETFKENTRRQVLEMLRRVMAGQWDRLPACLVRREGWLMRGIVLKS